MPEKQEKHMNVEQWVDLFRVVGLEESDMHRWHREFEQRYPDGHQSFLEWLGLPPERIRTIRHEASERA